MKYEDYELFTLIMNEFPREGSMRLQEWTALWDGLSKSSLTLEREAGSIIDKLPHRKILSVVPSLLRDLNASWFCFSVYFFRRKL